MLDELIVRGFKYTQVPPVRKQSAKQSVKTI